MKLLGRSVVSLVFVAAGMVAAASSCSTSPNGFGDDSTGGADGGGYTIVTVGDATFVQTEAGLVQVTVSDSGAVMVAPGVDATLPPPPGMDATTIPPGSDATVPPGSDATVPPGSDATVPPGSDATVPPGSDATVPPGMDAAMMTDGGCPDSGSAACSATVASGALKLASNYLSATAVGIGMGGYAYTYNDSMGSGGTSTACLDSTALCTSGMTDVSNGSATPNHYGAGVGFNLNQAQSTGCASMPIDAFTVPAGSAGISYSLSNLPPGGVRLEIGNAVTEADGAATGTDYCATLTAASGTIPWAQFNSQCWVNTPGDFLSGPPKAVTHINFGLPSGGAASSFNFCVDSVGFPTTIPDSGTGTTMATNCNGSSCCMPSSGPAANGNGVFSCYTFKQGTANDKTFCGYQGAESSGATPSGSGACQSGDLAYTDTVPNVANSKYFAAFPSSNSAWGQGAYCGMCVNVTYAGKMLMATIVDECATCGDSPEHIDLSAQLARDLGIGVGQVVGDPTGVTWAAVACPIPTSQNNGNIEVVYNSSGQAYFQNVVWPVKSVSGASQSDGFWSTVNAGSTVTLTDLIGHQITAVMPSGNGSLGKQFPSTCTN